MTTTSTTGDALARIEEALTRLIRRGSQPRAHERLAARAGVPLDRAGYGILCRVAEGGPIRLSDLAARTGIDVSTACRQVQHLQREGYVDRVVDPEDRRATLLRISDHGSQVLTAMRDARRDWVATVLAGWSPEDRAALSTLLSRLIDDIESSTGVRA